MKKTLVVCLYDYPYVTNGYIIDEEGEETYINADISDYDFSKSLEDESYFNELAKRLLEHCVNPEEREDVDKVLIVENADITYYGKLY